MFVTILHLLRTNIPIYHMQNTFNKECEMHIRHCERCDKEFILKNIAYEKRGCGRFCSKECSTRRIEFNESFFDNINTEEKAYWLGFIFADGNIISHKRCYSLTLGVSEIDIDHIKKFQQTLQTTHKLSTKNKTTGKYGQVSKPFYYIRVTSKHLVESLIGLGCVPNKSKTITFPNILPKLERHFIRGVFDGDGWITMYDKKHKYLKWSIYTGSKQFAQDLNAALSRHNIECKLYEKHQITNVSNGNVSVGYELSIANQKGIQNIFSFLYEQHTICLPRKLNKFKSP
jgi:intein/homing endonuclease